MSHLLPSRAIVNVEVLDLWVLVERVALSFMDPVPKFVREDLLEQRR